MKFTLIGFGRMGAAIEQVARQRGHELVSIVDPEAEGSQVLRSLDAEAVGDAEVAFEFSTPAAAESNVSRLLEANVAVVSGTTGWNPEGPAFDEAIRSSRAGAVVAPNFSVGMNLFYRVVREAATLAGNTGLYDPYIVEAHHRGKVDAPSGTAARLALIVQEAAPGYGPIESGCPEQGPVPPGAIHVASIRAGHEPGSHTVGFDGADDQIILSHRARSRGGFALGAVLAGEWIVGRRGLHGFDEVLEDLVAKGGRR